MAQRRTASEGPRPSLPIGATYNNISLAHPRTRQAQLIAEVEASSTHRRSRISPLHRTVDREYLRHTYMAAQRVSPPRLPPRIPSRQTIRSPPPAYRSRARSEERVPTERLPAYEFPPSYGEDAFRSRLERAIGSGLGPSGRPRAISVSSWESYGTFISEQAYGEYEARLEAQRDISESPDQSIPRRTRPQSRRNEQGRKFCKLGCALACFLPFAVFVTMLILWISSVASGSSSGTPYYPTVCALNETTAFTCLNHDAAPLCFGNELLAFDPAWKNDHWRAFSSEGGATLACKASMDFDWQDLLRAPMDEEHFVTKQWTWKCQEAKCTGQDCDEFEGQCVGNTSNMSPEERFEEWDALGRR